MKVRLATPEDADAIADVHVRAWQVGYAHVFPADRLAGLDVARRIQHWRDGLKEGWQVLVTEDVGGFVGFGPSREAPDEGEIYAIYVAPEHWGTGRAQALMAGALAELRAQGFERATLWVLEDNPRARRFYESAGWELDDAEKDDEFLDTPVREVRYRVTLR